MKRKNKLMLPNPKYAISERPELPLSSINAGCYHLRRGYHVAKSGKESARLYIEYRGQVMYITEQWLEKILSDKFTGVK